MQIDQESLIKIIEYWQGVAVAEELYDRDVVKEIDTGGRKVVDIVGIRRSGKSSLLRILYRRLSLQKKGVYINFEDPFFTVHNEPFVIEELIETYLTFFSKELKYIFLDEVQNITGWERAIRKYEEGGKYKFFVTGSSAKLLDGDLSRLLTGRHQSSRLLPLSFKEFLQFKNYPKLLKKDLIIKQRELGQMLKEYLLTGGFPEVVLTGKTEYLRQFYSDILQRDVIGRFDIRDRETIEKIGVFLLANAGNLLSIRSISRQYELSFPVTQNYLDYLAQSFLVYFVPQFSYSLKTQQKALKKVYGGDTGLINVASLKFSENLGRVLENAIYLELLRRKKKVYYFQTKGGKEIDFVVSDNGKFTGIQVCWDLSDALTSKREREALDEAQKELKLEDKIIIVGGHYTKNAALKTDIKITSAVEWLILL